MITSSEVFISVAQKKNNSAEKNFKKAATKIGVALLRGEEGPRTCRSTWKYHVICRKPIKRLYGLENIYGVVHGFHGAMLTLVPVKLDNRSA